MEKGTEDERKETSFISKDDDAEQRLSVVGDVGGDDGGSGGDGGGGDEGDGGGCEGGISSGSGSGGSIVDQSWNHIIAFKDAPKSSSSKFIKFHKDTDAVCLYLLVFIYEL